MRKSFLLHIDSLDVLSELTNEQKGILFQSMLDYHKTGEVALEGLMKVIFIPFKNQFDRDALKYENTCSRNKGNGSKGGRPKNPQKPKETQDNPLGIYGLKNNPKKPDNDNDNKNDNKNDNDNKSESKIEERKLKFANSLKPFVETYGNDMVRAFYFYWTEPNKSKSKLRFELEKTWDTSRRLETWASRDKDFKKPVEKNQHYNGFDTDEVAKKYYQ